MAMVNYHCAANWERNVRGPLENTAYPSSANSTVPVLNCSDCCKLQSGSLVYSAQNVHLSQACQQFAQSCVPLERQPEQQQLLQQQFQLKQQQVPIPGPSTAKEHRKKQAKNGKRSRTAFTSEQLAKMEDEFTRSRYLPRGRRVELAEALGLTERQIKIWYQNHRMKYKKMHEDILMNLPQKLSRKKKNTPVNVDEIKQVSSINSPSTSWPMQKNSCRQQDFVDQLVYSTQSNNTNRVVMPSTTKECKINTYLNQYKDCQYLTATVNPPLVQMQEDRPLHKVKDMFAQQQAYFSQQEIEYRQQTKPSYSQQQVECRQQTEFQDPNMLPHSRLWYHSQEEMPQNNYSMRFDENVQAQERNTCLYNTSNLPCSLTTNTNVHDDSYSSLPILTDLSGLLSETPVQLQPIVEEIPYIHSPENYEIGADLTTL